MTTTDDEMLTIIERIRKLLRLARAGSGATEAEMASALDHATRLLLKYNLEQVNLNDDGVAKSEPIDHEDLSITNEDWRRDLLRAIATANLCRTVNRVVRPAYKTWIPATVHLIGQPINRAATVELYNWVLAQIEGAPTGRTKRDGSPLLAGGLYQESWGGKPAETPWRDWRFGYMTGITSRMVERLEENTARAVMDMPGAMALMKTSELALKSYWHSTWNHGGHLGSQGTTADGGAHGVGRAHGDRVTLHKTSLGGARPMLSGGYR